jgi:hypothetical protein
MSNLEVATGGQSPSAHRIHGDEGTGGSRLNEWSALRDRSVEVQGDVADGHQRARTQELNKRTLAIALRDPRDLLDELANVRGLSWAAIARLVGVTDTAVRKWRKGIPMTGENRRRLAGVIAFLDLVGEALNPLHDASSWLEIPLADETTLTPVDLYGHGNANLLLDWASGRLDPTAMLDEFDPEWRARYSPSSRFTLEIDDDGMPVITERRPE